jgi:hypothetical protein
MRFWSRPKRSDGTSPFRRQHPYRRHHADVASQMSPDTAVDDGSLDQAIGSKNKLSVILFRSTLTQSTTLEGYPTKVNSESVLLTTIWSRSSLPCT